MMQAIQTKNDEGGRNSCSQEEAAAKAKEESELIEELKKDLEEANEKLKAAQGQADISSLSSKLKNSIQFVSTSRANVRSGGTGSAGIIAKVAKGSAISVTNTRSKELREYGATARSRMRLRESCLWLALQRGSDKSSTIV